MMLKEARAILLVLAVIAVLCILGMRFTDSRIPGICLGITVLLTLFTLYFFRSPVRTVPPGDSVLAPADGRIIEVEPAREDTYLKGECTKVGIFLSVFNVHVNRNPIGGMVEYQQFTPGKFAMAFARSASTQNQNNAIGIKNDRVRLLFKQISGFIARRVVSHLEVGQEVTRGEIFGMIRFGSRVDMYLPGNVEITVAVGDKAVAGETVIGEIR